MSRITAYTGADIFDGHTTHHDAALLILSGRVAGIIPLADMGAEYEKIELAGGLIAPGLVDLQVNGGGGVMLNNDTSVEAIRTICAAHARCGTTALLPTLITDTPDMTRRAITAVRQALAAKIPGIIGLHLEGPHLALSRKGAHCADLIRPMDENDCRDLEQLAGELPSLMLTVAPESVTFDQIRRLRKAGAVVSIGHSDCTYSDALGAADSGATSVTHLFNAMSQLTNREPGLVGAALDIGTLSAGIIADGIHVDAATISIALKAKQGPEHLFLISDAMATAGTDLTEFFLNGRRILRQDNKLTLEDGTLAGANLDLFTAVDFIVQVVGLAPEEALRMASLYPASILGRSSELGCLESGAKADFIWMQESTKIKAIWQQGRPVT